MIPEENATQEVQLIINKTGQKYSISKPKTGFGKTIITWQDGKPIHVETSYTEKIK